MSPSTRHSLATLLVAALAANASAAPNLDTAAIEQATGVKGTWNEKEGVFKLSIPRSDLKVDAAGVKMNPALAEARSMKVLQLAEEVLPMKRTLLSKTLADAVSHAVKTHQGARALSVTRSLKDGHPVADVVVVTPQGETTVSERLD